MADEEDPVNVYLRLNSWPNFPSDEEMVAGEEAAGDFGAIDIGGTYMLGFIMANIVGIAPNSGMITGREMVGLIRDPMYPYDSNAIRVFNIMNLQVGFVEKCVSDVLAPLLDDNLISIEGIVPNNQGRRAMIPCQIHVFAISGNVEGVYVAIARSGLELIRTDEECVRIPEIVRQNVDDGRRLNDIFKVESQGGMVEVMEAPKEVIKSELFLHQKEGLAWMVKRENSGELPPFWVEKSGGSFYFEISNMETNERPTPLHGGIFADDMGMGKTLTLLSLIALDKCGYGNNLLLDGGGSGSNVVDDDEEEFVVYGGKNPKKWRGTKMVSRIRKRHRGMGNLDNAGHEFNLVDGIALRTTLVVCPPSVFSTWLTQLGEHTKPGKLKVYLYYGDRTDDPMELRKYDIVLTTYTTLGSELNSESPMFRVVWWRVILDEAHMIKNALARQTRAVNKLTAKRRWLVTGTPIQNGTVDLFSLMSFLRYQPFANRNYWNTLVQRPVDHGDESGLTRLQVYIFLFWSISATPLIILCLHTAYTYLQDLLNN